ncbi:HAD family phosphatase [Actinoplanes sp. LDG1-06]|uniref:HAD family phosphatase n=1 Tax=Paractinoplanes ovalisporus TaxID=2810368 RepID=A0ABS2AK43_9ACTN|nr:HAD family phosphatase [Actinoplanes ovalisporus]
MTDLDGTIVLAGDVVTPATVAAAGRLRELGIPLVAATARSPAGVGRLGGFGRGFALAVGNGGSRGWDPATGRTLWEEFIEPDELQDLAGFVGSMPGAGMSAFVVDGRVMTPEHVVLRGGLPSEPWREMGLGDLWRKPAYAVDIRHPTLSSDELVAGLTAAGLSRRVTISYSADHLVDIGPLGVDKGTGVRRALDLLGLSPAEAVAFGDMPNDLPMFAACGRSVAMGNAHTTVRAAATRVTGSAAEDGFARALTGVGGLLG